ncbi:PRC-barrel domain-containing protein [Teichococcus oryzae]|uniref:PRC-barrel domain containing protein n=1 Tax=Teichococcus oryzae TaxID=1608942 RepID=A0A5B2TE62_9PROT|nr:PRC-barrel domain-containing protein [Pseudoroseomonas oryzae]KAA2212394.1 PRC-barrel domain containing protein [Pseudoroseomonas oryzae]
MKLSSLLAATSLSLFLGMASLPALAQAPQTGLEAGQSRAKMLLDRDAYSSDDVEIGEVEDLILNAQNQVVLVIIEVESRLGFTDKYVAVPVAQVTPSANNRDRVTVAMTRDQLRNLPGFKYQD